MMMRDFNCFNIYWETISTKHGPFRKFLSCLADNFLPQRIEEGIRKLAILDMILINREDLVKEIKNSRNIQGK